MGPRWFQELSWTISSERGCRLASVKVTVKAAKVTKKDRDIIRDSVAHLALRTRKEVAMDASRIGRAPGVRETESALPEK